MTNKTLYASQHDTDPKEALIKSFGDLSDIRLSGYQVMVGIYIRPEKTKGGLQRTQQERNEDKFQNPLGVILKMGPLAFGPDDPAGINNWEEGCIPSVGDWIFFNLHDGRSRAIRGNIIRILESKQVRGVTNDPDIIV